MKPRANIKGANKDAKIYVGRSTTLHNLLFCAHILYMNYVINTFLLVSSSVGINNYCVVCNVKAKTENKNVQQRTLLGSITILSIHYVITQFLTFSHTTYTQSFNLNPTQ